MYKNARDLSFEINCNLLQVAQWQQIEKLKCSEQDCYGCSGEGEGEPGSRGGVPSYTAVASAQRENRGTVVEEPVVAPVEVTDGQKEEALEPAVGGVQQSGGLLPPLSTGRTAEIEEEFAVARTERKRKYTSWRQDVEHKLNCEGGRGYQKSD